MYYITVDLLQFFTFKVILLLLKTISYIGLKLGKMNFHGPFHTTTLCSAFLYIYMRLDLVKRTAQQKISGIILLRYKTRVMCKAMISRLSGDQ